MTSELGEVAAKALTDEYSVWLGGRVAEELRLHAKRGSSVWMHCFRVVAPRIGTNVAQYAWHTANPPQSDAAAILAVRHCQPYVRSIALARLSDEFVENHASLLFQVMFDRGTELGTDEYPPAVAAAFRLRNVRRDSVPEFVPMLRLLVEKRGQLLSGAAAVALQPDEAPPRSLAQALKDLSSGYRVPPSVIAELEATEPGRVALDEVWPSRKDEHRPMFSVGSGSSPVVVVSPLSPATTARVAHCLEHGLRSLPDDLLSIVLQHRTPQSDVAVCSALLAGDLRPLFKFGISLRLFSPPAQRVLSRAALANPAIATRLILEWHGASAEARTMAVFPGLALEGLALAGNGEFLEAYLAWLENGYWVGGVYASRLEPRVFEIPRVLEMARKVTTRLIDLVRVGGVDHTGDHGLWATGAVAGALNGLWPAWRGDESAIEEIVGWISRRDSNDFRTGLHCLEGVPLKETVGKRVRVLILSKFSQFVQKENDVTWLDVLAGLRWFDRNGEAAAPEALEAVRRLFEKPQVRGCAAAVALPHLSEKEAASLSAVVAREAVVLDSELLKDTELTRLVGVAPEAWAAAVTMALERTFVPDPNMFRVVGALPQRLKIEVAKAIYVKAADWEVPWFHEWERPLGRPADRARMLLFDAGLDLRELTG